MSRFFILLWAVGLIGAAAGSLEVPQSVTNEMCPVMPEEPVDEAIFTEYEGQRVYLCCQSCRKEFLENPTAFTGNLPQFAAAIGRDSQDEGHVSPGSEGVAREEDAHAQREEAAHDHAQDHGQPQGLGRAIRFAGKFHPLVVHFPIALALVAVVAEVLAIVTGRNFYADAARFSIVVGAVSAVGAVALGSAAGAFAHYPGALGRALTIHGRLGTASGAALVLAGLFSEWYHRNPARTRLLWAYRFALFAGALLVAVAGHFGGVLIFGLDHFTW